MLERYKLAGILVFLYFIPAIVLWILTKKSEEVSLAPAIWLMFSWVPIMILGMFLAGGLSDCNDSDCNDVED